MANDVLTTPFFLSNTDCTPPFQSVPSNELTCTGCLISSFLPNGHKKTPNDTKYLWNEEGIYGVSYVCVTKIKSLK